MTKASRPTPTAYRRTTPAASADALERHLQTNCTASERRKLGTWLANLAAGSGAPKLAARLRRIANPASGERRV